jgi:hypothetical protein
MPPTPENRLFCPSKGKSRQSGLAFGSKPVIIGMEMREARKPEVTQMDTKTFAFRDLLSVTTGRALTEPKNGGNGIENLCELLDWMTNESPFTHQLPRFISECDPWLRRWFPELSKVDAFLPELDKALEGASLGKFSRAKTESIVKGWLIRVQVDCNIQDAYRVARIPRNDHETKDAWDELVAMRGTDEGIIVV